MGWFTASRRNGGDRDGRPDRADVPGPSAGTAGTAADAGTAATADERTATDRRLIRAIVRHGSRSAADRLVRAYFDDVYAFVWRVTGDREHAMDLTQETMIAALRALPSYDPDRASVRTWMYAIASHKVIDARRANRVSPTPLDMTPGAAEPIGDLAAAPTGTASARDPADVEADADLLARVDAFVGRFDAGTQEIFHLRTAAGLTFPQIAAARGEHTEAVKARYHRLIQTIRKEFGDERAV